MKKQNKRSGNDKKKEECIQEEEPQAAPIVAKKKEAIELCLDIDEAELKQKDITQTKAYQSLIVLLQLVFNNDEEEITKQALLHADNCKDGLNIMMAKGQIIVKHIQATSLQNNSQSKIKNQIIDDFDRALTIQENKLVQLLNSNAFKQSQQNDSKQLSKTQNEIQKKKEQPKLNQKEQQKSKRQRKKEKKSQENDECDLEDLYDTSSFLKFTQYKPTDSQEAKDDRQFLADVYGLENEESNTKLNILCSIYEELKVKGGTVGETTVMKCLMSHGESNQNDSDTEEEKSQVQSKISSQDLSNQHSMKKMSQINKYLQNNNFKYEDKCILIYHQILEEIFQCYHYNKRIDRIDKKIYKVCEQNKNIMIGIQDYNISKGSYNYELVKEMEKAVALKLKAKDLLSLERDVERLEDIHKDIQMDLLDQDNKNKNQFQVNLKKIDVQNDDSQLTASIIQDCIKSIQIQRRYAERELKQLEEIKEHEKLFEIAKNNQKSKEKDTQLLEISQEKSKADEQQIFVNSLQDELNSLKEQELLNQKDISKEKQEIFYLKNKIEIEKRKLELEVQKKYQKIGIIEEQQDALHQLVTEKYKLAQFSINRRDNHL